ncbi:MAG: circularly permuted type 2 ATP-grasp protein [Solirubrobacteraceae bacterium]
MRTNAAAEIIWKMATDLVDITPAQLPRGYDEVRADADAYGELLDAIAAAGLAAVSHRVRRRIEAAGVRFGGGAGEFAVDPVPRIITAVEWDRLALALAQRTRALECFVADIYGEQSILAAGVVPREAVLAAPFYEPQLRGLDVRRWIPLAGLDVVRAADGRFLVLEDNVRTPSGLAYAMAARQAVGSCVAVPAGRGLRTLAGAPGMLLRALHAAAPDQGGEPRAVVLTDGPSNVAFYEHRALAQLMAVPLAFADQLRVRAGRLWLHQGGKRSPVDVLYRRTNGDRLFEPDGRLSALGELLHEPLRRGRLGVVNAFGTGVADDKLLHSYAGEMVRFYLGEESLIDSVHSHDLSRADILDMVLERIAELVVKPRDGHGGAGVVIGPRAGARELSRARAELKRDPSSFVAQELVALSHHPTVTNGRLAGRRIDLRAFVAAAGDGLEVVAGGLTRVALQAGSFVVNSSRGGGAKDTWILA